jgi:hypothetical protein
MTRAFIITLALLILSLAWIAYREAVLSQSISTESHSALLAEVAKRHEAERDRIKNEHQYELESLLSELEADREKKQAQISLLTDELEAARRNTLAVAQSGPEGLKRAISDVVGIPPGEVTVTETVVELSHPAAVAWVDLTLRLQDELTLCDSVCDLRLTDQKADLLPPLVMARQAAEVEAGKWKHETEVLSLDLDHARRVARIAKADTVKWSLVSGGVGLAAGFTAGILTGAFAI